MPPTSAARCRTRSTGCSAKRRSTSASRVRSYWARRGITTLEQPAVCSRATTVRPRKPAPPVTSTRASPRLRAPFTGSPRPRLARPVSGSPRLRLALPPRHELVHAFDDVGAVALADRVVVADEERLAHDQLRVVERAGDAVREEPDGRLVPEVAGHDRPRLDSPALEEAHELVAGERRVRPHADRIAEPHRARAVGVASGTLAQPAG